MPELFQGVLRSAHYLPMSTIVAGVNSIKVISMQINITTLSANFFQGTVPVPTFTKPVLLVGRENLNRAVQKDILMLKVFREWKDRLTRSSNWKALRAEHTKKAPAEKQLIGRVVCIIKRIWRANATSLGLQMVFATPVSRLLPRIWLRTRQAPSLVRNKIAVAIDRWGITSRYPEGHFVSTLGKTESKEAEQESLSLEFEVPYRPFGKVILDCLPSEGEQWVVPPKSAAIPEWRDRADLRDLIICSIDPPAGVHIADVSHFVHLEIDEQ
ncbi:hypothetical protein F4604DRAFT_1688263 [Suillus subluteus]|nr:hypothetical protein F4604DRAFT_1688263 [Suillus subluteus]